MSCEGCGSPTSQRVWGRVVCGRCFAELAPNWPESGDAEAKYPTDAERHAAYRAFVATFIEKKKARAA